MPETSTTDMKTLHRAQSIRSSDILLAIAVRPEDDRLLLGSSDAGVYELDLRAEKPERLKFRGEGHRSYVTGVAVAGSRAITCSYDGQLIWWDLESREQARAVAAHDKWIRRVIASPSGQWLASVADDMRIRIWDVQSGERLAEFSDHPPTTPHHFPSMLYALAVSADGHWLASGDRIGHVAIWDTQTWTKTAELEAPVMYTWDPKARRHSIGGIRSLAFSPDGNQLAVGGTGKINNIDHLEGRSRVEIFEWRTGKRHQELEDEKRKGLVEQLVWIPDTPHLLAAGGDSKGFITVYDATSGELVHQDGSDGHIHGVVWDAATEQLFVAAHERVEAWKLGTAS